MRLGSCYFTKTHQPFNFSKTPIIKKMDSSIKKDKIIVIMGATGTGKSRLSIDLATRFFPSEVINSDKIQVYRGLDITTNKISMEDRLGVPHHLLGEFDSELGELTPADYRAHASSAIEEILGRNKLPLIVGGSNTFIHALLTHRFDPDQNSDNIFTSDSDSLLAGELRYDCCFLWVDVGLPVLCEYLFRRVDEMLESGMLEELAEFFESESELDRLDRERVGIRKAIGVPELEEYFRTRIKVDGLAEEGIRAIKVNTWQLAVKQIGRIKRLRSSGGWDLRRLNATEVFKAVLSSSDSDDKKASEIWEKEVVEPSVKIVKRFLDE